MPNQHSTRFSHDADVGAPWRDFPERFGPWSTAWNLFRRWAAAGVWQRVLEALQRAANFQGRLD
jgi:transposase